MDTPAAIFRFGPYELRPRTRELYKHGVKIRLRPQPFRVLQVLLEHAGEPVSREELRGQLWPSDTFVDFEHGLNTSVKELRAVLSDSTDKPRYIETLPRLGYRFLAEVRKVLVIEPPVEKAPHESQAAVTLARPRWLALRRWGVVAAMGFSIRLRVLLAGVAVLALLSVGLVLNRRAKGTGPAPIKSLAVLPLKNLSGEPAQEYLADGMTEELIGRLAAIHDLRVISRTSVMRLRDTQLSVPEISKMLGVDAIVEGSVMREGSRIRVHAQLIRAASDEHFWTETYDREMRDVLTLQSDVAQSIARRVQVTVTGEERSRLVAARHVAPEVYESYLKGRFALDKWNSPPDLERSIGYFEQATKEDPTFAPAYVGLADAYDRLGKVLAGAPPDEMRPKAISAVRKALELDPELAEAHVLLAEVYRKRLQWSDAEAEYKRALELRPNNAAAHLGLASWLMCQERTDEALAWAQRGRELDPLAVSGDALGWILFLARRYNEAIRELRATLAVKPNDPHALWTLGFVLVAQGKPEDAITVLEKAVSITHGSPGVIGVLIRAYAHAGRRKDALQLLAELKRRKQAGYVPAAAFVQAYVGLGDNDQAFAWLEQAYKEQSNILQWLKVEPTFDPLRGDPRFADLLHRVGLDR